MQTDTYVGSMYRGPRVEESPTRLSLICPGEEVIHRYNSRQIANQGEGIVLRKLWHKKGNTRDHQMPRLGRLL